MIFNNYFKIRLIKEVFSVKITIRKSFERFLSKHHLTVTFIKKIITEYATSDLEVARSYFVDTYNISEHVFYKCRDFAVICGIVNNHICELLKQKTSENYGSHNESNSQQASITHFHDLMRKRADFIFEFSNDEIRQIGESYTKGDSTSQIALRYNTGTYCIKRLLNHGITNLIFSRELVDGIIKKLEGNEDYISRALNERKKSINSLISILKKEIETLESKIQFYDLYFVDGDADISVDELKEQLVTTNKRYENVLKL